MKLYSFGLSGHSHRVRLLLSFLGIEHEFVEVDLSSYARVICWLRRLEGLPDFVIFKGVPVGLAA